LKLKRTLNFVQIRDENSEEKQEKLLKQSGSRVFLLLTNFSLKVFHEQKQKISKIKVFYQIEKSFFAKLCSS
jgi:hypothetical protein